MGRQSVEVTSWVGGLLRTATVFVNEDDPARSDPHVAELVDGAVARAVEILGNERDGPWALLALMVERMADEAVYEREAARRGFLPL